MKYVIAYEHYRLGFIYWSGTYRAVGAGMSVMIEETALLHEARICDTYKEAKEILSELIDRDCLSRDVLFFAKEITDKELFDARLKGT